MKLSKGSDSYGVPITVGSIIAFNNVGNLDKGIVEEVILSKTYYPTKLIVRKITRNPKEQEKYGYTVKVKDSHSVIVIR